MTRRALCGQGGAALLGLVAAVVLGSSWWIYSSLSLVNRTALERQHNARVLGQAKQALLGWIAHRAANQSEQNPGRFPCPEALSHVGNSNYEGISAPYVSSGATTCSNAGRLPWRTIGIDRLRDAAGEPLWYVVTVGSNGWALQTSSTTLSINSNKTGGIALNGNANAIVAAVIAPGRAMNVQPNAAQAAAGCASRVQSRTASPPNYLDYLECHTLGTDAVVNSVVDNATHPVFNDQVITITAAEVMAVIEPIVAERMRTSVVPELKSVLETAYASAAWGASSAAPILPFAARFQDAGTFNPDAYKGSSGTTQGLLPLTTYTCNTLTAGRCDATFLQWNTAGGAITVTKTGGTANITSYTCAASTPSMVTCTVNYSGASCTGIFGTCTRTLSIQAAAAARNVGMTLRTQSTSGISGLLASPVPTMTAPIDASGTSNVVVSGSMTSATCTYVFGSCTPSRTTILTIPITVFPDHPFLNPATTDAWYWFLLNKWFEVTYYAIAPSHAPSGAIHNCASAGDCLTVTGITPSTNLRAIIVFAGRSVTSTARPNADITDLLENISGFTPPAPNRDGDTSFQQGTVNRSYNDRFFSLSNY